MQLVRNMLTQQLAVAQAALVRAESDASIASARSDRCALDVVEVHEFIDELTTALERIGGDDQ